MYLYLGKVDEVTLDRAHNTCRDQVGIKISWMSSSVLYQAPGANNDEALFTLDRYRMNLASRLSAFSNGTAH